MGLIYCCVCSRLINKSGELESWKFRYFTHTVSTNFDLSVLLWLVEIEYCELKKNSLSFKMAHISFFQEYLIWNQFTLGIYSIGHLRLTVVNKTRTKKCIHSIKLQLEVSSFFALILWMHSELKSRIQFGNWFESKQDLFYILNCL